jgi:hypothetical protein
MNTLNIDIEAWEDVTADLDLRRQTLKLRIKLFTAKLIEIETIKLRKRNASVSANSSGQENPSLLLTERSYY